MVRKAVYRVAVFVVAGAASACNSTDNLYRQGPWGAATTPRSYSAYSAPWGGPPAGAAYGVAVPPIPEPIHIVEAPVRPARKGYDVHLEPELPSRPLLGRSALDVGADSELLAESVPQQPAPARHGASTDVGANAPGVFTPPRRPSSYAGTWKVSVGSASCRIQLSSVSSLDLYKASAQGCSSDALRTVNGWSIRDDQVILFSRGQVVARLSGAEASLSGKLNGSEAELTMTR